MADDALHDFRLDGKQLVFLFMASTIVAVVVFLCGVMVGRGVHVPRPSEPAQVTAVPESDPTASTGDASTGGVVPAVSSNATGTTAATTASTTTAVAVPETLSYPDRLGAPDTPSETVQAPATSRSSSTAEPASAASGRGHGDTVSVPAGTAPGTTATSPSVSAAAAGAGAPTGRSGPAADRPAGAGFVVQVAATRDRGEADTIVRRLNGKGYPTFVTSSTGGARLFRVRVGTYSDRREAESVAARLEKEEQFKPWITR